MEPRARLEVSPDKATATITFLPASGATGSLTVNSEQLLTLIRALGEVHATMTADVEPAPLEGQQIRPVAAPWHTQPAFLGEASLLAFAHPAFGSIGFALPIDQVELMASLLTRQAEAARAARGTPQ